MGFEQMDILEMIGSAGLVVQLVMLTLLLFSVISWAIIIIKFNYLRKAYKESAYFTEFFWKSRWPALSAKPNSFATAPSPEFFA